MAGLALGAVVTALFGEPHLVWTGPNPPAVPTEFEIRQDNSPLVLMHMADTKTFRNWGLKSDHIESLKIAPRGVTQQPEDVKVQCDQTEIYPFMKKDIRCEFWVVLDPRKPPARGGELQFQTIYYATGGKQIDTGGSGLTIHRTW